MTTREGHEEASAPPQAPSASSGSVEVVIQSPPSGTAAVLVAAGIKDGSGGGEGDGVDSRGSGAGIMKRGSSQVRARYAMN